MPIYFHAMGHVHSVPELPHIPRVSDFVVLFRQKYVVSKVVHDLDERRIHIYCTLPMD